MSWLRILHVLGLTNLSDAQVARYEQIRGARADRLDVLEQSETPRESATLPRIRGSIIFDHVTFRHGAHGPVILKDLNFQIDPGQIVGIVGPVGSGKTTVLNLLQGKAMPVAGRVLIDGIDLATVDSASLSSQIGFVSSNAAIFAGTIGENISGGNPTVSVDRIIEASRLARAHDFIVRKPGGYETWLVSSGDDLSEVERQRIAIARVIAADPRILVVDEIPDALSEGGSDEIESNLRTIGRGRTVVIASRRPRDVLWMDRVIILNQGSIVADTTPNELTQDSRVFRSSA
jgi:subfamily B ATP-binding cassette protein HlyB/CyaB